MPHTTACAGAVVAGRPMRMRPWGVVGVLLLVALAGPLPQARPASAAPSRQEESATAPAVTLSPTPPAVSPAPTAESSPIATEAPTPSPTAETPTPETTPSPTAPPSPAAEAPTPLPQPPTPTAPLTPPPDTPQPSPATDTPTAAPLPTPEATSTPYAGDPPLELDLQASSPQVAPGSSLSYQLQLGSTSATPHGVLVLTKLDPHLTVVSVSVSNGICQLGAVVVCNVSVQRGQPVSMRLDLRVRADVRPGQVLVSQASARDTAYNAASSEPVRVTVMAPQELRPGAPAGPTATPGSATAQPAPTARQPHRAPDQPTPSDNGRITGTVIDLSSGAPAPGVRVRIGETTVSSDTSGNYSLGELAPGTYQIALALEPDQGDPAQPPLALTLAPGAILVQHLMFRSPTRPIPPPAVTTAAGLPAPGPHLEHTPQPQATTRVQADVAGLLPNTAGAPAAAAAVLTLVGLALLLRSLRRVRRAAALLADQSNLAAQLGPLLRAAQRRQRRLREQIEEAQNG